MSGCYAQAEGHRSGRASTSASIGGPHDLEHIGRAGRLLGRGVLLPRFAMPGEPAAACGVTVGRVLSAGPGQLTHRNPDDKPQGADMFEALHRFLTRVDDAHRTDGANAPAFALAVLLIEVARSDDDRVEDREHGVIERGLALCFGLEHGEVTRLITAA